MSSLNTTLNFIKSYRGDCEAVTHFLQKGIETAINGLVTADMLTETSSSLGSPKSASNILKVIVFSFLIALDTTLRGISQVFLCNNPVSGIFILIGLCISTDSQLGPLSLLGSFTGFCGGMASLFVHMTAVPRQERNKNPSVEADCAEEQKRSPYRIEAFSDAMHRGLYGYDGALVACGTRVFLSTLIVEVDKNFEEATAGSLAVTYAVGALLGFIHRAFGLPTLTLTFNMVILLSLYALGGPSKSFLDTKQTIVTSQAGSSASSSVEAQLATVSCCLPASALCNRTALPIPNAVEQTEIIFEAYTNALVQARCSAFRGPAVLAEGWVLGASAPTSVLPGAASSSVTASPLLLDDTDPALLDISSGDWAIAIVLGVSQFMFVDTLEGGILVLVGILFATTTGCVLAITGSTVSLLSATFLIKVSYRKTSWFATRGNLAASHVSENPVKLQSLSVKVFSSAICPLQATGSPAELSTVCVPVAKSTMATIGISPVTANAVPWTVPVSSIRNGLAGYNGGGTMACLGSAALTQLLRWRKVALAEDSSDDSCTNQKEKKMKSIKSVSVMPAAPTNAAQHEYPDDTAPESSTIHSPAEIPPNPAFQQHAVNTITVEVNKNHMQESSSKSNGSLMFEIAFVFIGLSIFIYCCAAVFVSSVFFAALPTVLPLSAPVMTLPFVLTTYIFMTPLVAATSV